MLARNEAVVEEGPVNLTWCHNRLAIGNACVDGVVERDATRVASALKAAGVTHLLNLRRDPGFMGGLVAVEVLSGIVVYWNPAEDDGAPKPADWFARSIDFALHALANPRHKVAVCCYHGNNRAPSTALAVLMAQGLSYERAANMVCRCRPGCQMRYSSDVEVAIKELGYC